MTRTALLIIAQWHRDELNPLCIWKICFIYFLYEPLRGRSSYCVWCDSVPLAQVFNDCFEPGDPISSVSYWDPWQARPPMVQLENNSYGSMARDSPEQKLGSLIKQRGRE